MSARSNSFADLACESLSRRGFLTATAALPSLSLMASEAQAAPAGFKAVAENRLDTVVVPEGYVWQPLVSWGDPLFEGMEPLQPQKRGAPFAFTRAEQENRFGTHNDMLALFPANWAYPWPEGTVTRAIMCVNHEAVSPFMAAPGSNGQPIDTSTEALEALYACMGVSVFDVAHDPASGAWSVVKGPAIGVGRNRRVTPYSEVVFDGSAANHPWIAKAGAIVNEVEGARSGAPKVSGAVKAGTFQNCAGGFTPWGTYLTAEENFNSQFFTSNKTSPALVEAQADAAFAADQSIYRYDNIWRLGGPAQFDLSRNPHGPSLYGWIVEIDPYDPDWRPHKHTALGRKANECATTVLSKTNKAVVYTGDDSNNQFVYKFVSRDQFDPTNRIANRSLLAHGTLYAARLEADGTGRWIALTAAAANRAPRGPNDLPFTDEGDVMVRCREAALRLGATKMDRPEDVESPTDGSFRGTGTVFVMCTGNLSDSGRAGNVANPRRKTIAGDGLERNYQGHIVRIEEARQDPAALTFTWDIFAVAGDPSAEVAPATNSEGQVVNVSSWLGGKPTTTGDRFAMPDNITFDHRKFCWISTDGTPDTFPCNDGVYVMPMVGKGPRPVKRFLTVPVGAECCGPLLAWDQKTFFCGVQHVGAESTTGQGYRGEPTGPYSNFPNGGWPRDTVVYVRRKDGGTVGT